MNLLSAAIALLGPLLTMEWLISIERRRVLHFQGVNLPLLCTVLTLSLLFFWPVALILLLTAMATTDRKG